MKHISSLMLLFFLIGLHFLPSGIKAASIDTLTFRRAYNLNVGDTFDYIITDENSNYHYYSSGYVRRILMQKSFNGNMDSIYLHYLTLTPYGNGEFTDAYRHLDSLAIFNTFPSNSYIGCSTIYRLDTTTFPGVIFNGINIMCLESGASAEYAEQLGRTYYNMGSADNSGTGCVCYTEQMVYYSKLGGTVTFGNSGFVPIDSSYQVHYIPLPEECAVWTWSKTGFRGQGGPQSVIEQVRTGNKIHKNGRAFVELIYRCENLTTGGFINDSLLGYFYNDNSTYTAYFVSDTNGNGQKALFVGSVLPGTGCGSSTGYYQLSQIVLGGLLRDQWTCNGSSNNCFVNGISGIGSNTGLLEVYALGNVSLTASACGRLLNLSICGQSIYPSDTTPAYQLLTEITETSKSIGVKIYPNPTNDRCKIILDNNDAGCSAVLQDVSGKVIRELFSNLGSNSFEFNTSDIAAGLYFIRITNQKGQSCTAKLIRQ